MMRLVYGGLATVVFLVGLAVQMPATVVVGKVQEFARQRLSLGEVQGTVWNGKAKISCLRPDKSAERCGDWQWAFAPQGLKEAKLRWQLKGSGPNESAVVSFSLNGFQVESLSAAVPAFFVSGIDAKLEALQLSGRLRVNGRQLAMKDGQADIVWTNLASRLIPSVNLGELTLVLVGGQQGWNLGLSSGGGPIQIAGEGQVSLTGQIRLNATIAVGSDRVRLAPLITALGVETTPGVYSLQLP